MVTKSKWCNDTNCIQWPAIKIMNDKIDKLAEKVDNKFEDLIKHNEELWARRDAKLDWFMEKIEKNYVTKEMHNNMKEDYAKFKDRIWAVLLLVIWWVISLIFKLF